MTTPPAPRQCALAILVWGVLLAAATASSHAAGAPLTLPEALDRAMRDNPDLRSARAREQAAHADSRSARVPPDPNFAYTPGNPSQFSVSQPLDVGPQRLFRTAQAGHALHAARLDLADTERMVRFEVRQAYFDVMLADTLAALARGEAGMLAQISAADSVRFASGEVPERTVTRSAIEATVAAASAERSTAAARAARLTLGQLLGTDQPDTSLTLAGELRYAPVPLDDGVLGTLATEARPDLAAARERVAAARAGSRLALAELLPVPQLSWVHQQDQPFPSGSHDAFGVGFSVPVFSVFGGERERARAGAEQARIDSLRAHTAASAGLATAIDAFATSRRLAAHYAGGLLDHAADALETSRFAYERGAISQLEFIDAVRADQAVRADACTALHDYWVAAYALDRETGKELVP